MKIQRLSTCSFKFYSPNGQVVLLDPWLTNDPLWPIAEKTPEKLKEIDVIAVTHAHFDHCAGIDEIVRHNQNVTVIAQLEYALSLGRRGITNVIPTSYGATLEFRGLKFSMVPASHSSSTVLSDGTVEIFGTAAGYVMEFEDGQKVYAAGDTGLTADMKFVVADYHKPDIALLPVIGHLSMEPEQAAYAARVVGCKYVIPFHDFPKDPSQAADPDGYREFFKRAAVAESYRKVERFMALMEKDYPEIEAIYIPIGGTVDIG